MSDRAVFFDPSRRRWWWVKRFGTLAGLVAAVTTSFWLLSLFAAPILPGFEGITIPIKRALRHQLHPLRHQARLKQFLADRERKNLLAGIGRDKQQRLARAARPPIRSNNIVAAFYAPWQEIGMHSLDANAQSMTHLMPVWLHLSADGRCLDKHDWD